jgi:hypothetical protein
MFKKKTPFSAITACFFLVATSLHVQARVVDSVIIEASGLSMEPERISTERCKSFEPTVEQVIHYFNNAYPVEADFATRERYTPCYAKGKLKFSDNFSGEWLLYSSGTASFNFQLGDFVTFYYQNNEWNDPTNGEYAPRWKKEY